MAEDDIQKVPGNITESAKKALGIQKVNINGREKNKPWFTEEVETLLKEKKVTYIRYKNIREVHNKREIERIFDSKIRTVIVTFSDCIDTVVRFLSPEKVGKR